MKTFRSLRTAGTLAVLGALAVPAFASAHGSVYTTQALVPATPATTPATFVEQTRYVVANHGFTYVLRESNGKTTRGMINYAQAPSALRSQPGFPLFENYPTGATTGAQPHAICDVAALTSDTAIRAWQGTDPFYAYVPFQRGSAGLEDDPTTWIPLVKEKTGVDLNAVADTDAAREAACEALPGATSSSYVPADAVQSTNAAFNSGLIAEISGPFENKISALLAANAAADQAKTSAEQGRAAADQAKTAAEAKLAAVPPVKPLAAKLAKSSLTAKTIASKGLVVAVTGPAGQTVQVRASVSAAQAKKHGLKSTTLGSKAGKLGSDGTLTITVKPSSAAAQALKKIKKGKLPVAVELVAASAKATVTR